VSHQQLLPFAGMGATEASAQRRLKLPAFGFAFRPGAFSHRRAGRRTAAPDRRSKACSRAPGENSRVRARTNIAAIPPSPVPRLFTLPGLHRSLCGSRTTRLYGENDSSSPQWRRIPTTACSIEFLEQCFCQIIGILRGTRAPGYPFYSDECGCARRSQRLRKAECARIPGDANSSPHSSWRSKLCPPALDQRRMANTGE
jgi:hypothetical protein